jgi:hypothetical protein
MVSPKHIPNIQENTTGIPIFQNQISELSQGSSVSIGHYNSFLEFQFLAGCVSQQAKHMRSVEHG